MGIWDGSGHLEKSWEDVQEKEYKVGDTADLVNSFKKQIPEGVKPIKSIQIQIDVYNIEQ